MDYAEAHAAFFQPRSADAPPPRTAQWQTAARRLRDAAEPVATVSFWSAEVDAGFAEQGLDFLHRLRAVPRLRPGRCRRQIVASAFGVFEPGLIGGLWDVARKACSVERMLASGLAWPEDPYGALWHGCTMLRELRGDGHLAA